MAATRRRHFGLPELTLSTWLLALTLSLCALGVIMVWSASSVVGISLYGSSLALLAHELEFMAAGVILLLIMRTIDYHLLRNLAFPILAVAFGGLAAVRLVGVSTMGSARWIRLPGGFTLQPSEFMKFAISLYVAQKISQLLSMKKPAIAAGSAALIVLMQPDMGSALIIIGIFVAVVFRAGLPWRSVTAILFGLMFLAMVAAVAMPYRMARITGFLGGSENSLTSGYQVTQSLVGLGSGGLTGVGLGNSKEKWGLLPNPHTDFIFSIIGEELGLIGALIVLALFIALVMVGLRVAMSAKDQFGSLLATAITIWIGLEAIVNIGATLKLLPVTSIPLPLISFGGTSLLCTLAAIGVLLSIARREETGAKVIALRPRRAVPTSSGQATRKTTKRNTSSRPPQKAKNSVTRRSVGTKAATTSRASSSRPQASPRRAPRPR
ncbi:MAG: putative peptidoglycan glycosyltransferase FtsW [Actinobacteria bacterium]|nr:putative peptidoglycan glycosyltransferase FtsW [Actinomycetota bacterium]